MSAAGSPARPKRWAWKSIPASLPPRCYMGRAARSDLAKEREPQKFGIGLKELWKVAPEKHKPGLVQHSFGWPLDNATGGGSFLYHFDDNLVSVGFVVHLNYSNPYLKRD